VPCDVNYLEEVEVVGVGEEEDQAGEVLGETPVISHLLTHQETPTQMSHTFLAYHQEAPIASMAIHQRRSKAIETSPKSLSFNGNYIGESIIAITSCETLTAVLCFS